jgi:hypothetical protein
MPVLERCPKLMPMTSAWTDVRAGLLPALPSPPLPLLPTISLPTSPTHLSYSPPLSTPTPPSLPPSLSPPDPRIPPPTPFPPWMDEGLPRLLRPAGPCCPADAAASHHALRGRPSCPLRSENGKVREKTGPHMRTTSTATAPGRPLRPDQRPRRTDFLDCAWSGPCGPAGASLRLPDCCRARPLRPPGTHLFPPPPIHPLRAGVCTRASPSWWVLTSGRPLSLPLSPPTPTHPPHFYLPNLTHSYIHPFPALSGTHLQPCRVAPNLSVMRVTGATSCETKQSGAGEGVRRGWAASTGNVIAGQRYFRQAWALLRCPRELKTLDLWSPPHLSPSYRRKSLLLPRVLARTPTTRSPLSPGDGYEFRPALRRPLTRRREISCPAYPIPLPRRQPLPARRTCRRILSSFGSVW